MKLTYLGTAAAEGFPAVFCNCEYCNMARKLKGKNIRTRSQSLINDDLLIDLCPDTYYHFLSNNIEGDKIKYLLVTHSHEDHFYYDELKLRHGFFAHNMREKNLEVFCSDGVHKIFEEKGVFDNTIVYKVTPFETFNIGDYTITPLPARHFFGDGAVIYIIKGDKTLLYAHDTGYLYEEVFEYIEKNNIRFDMASFDCTHVDIKISDEDGHMGIDNIERVVERLKTINAVDDETIMYINHFSHNANPLHHVLEDRVKDLNLKVSYDGCKVEF